VSFALSGTAPRALPLKFADFSSAGLPRLLFEDFELKPGQQPGQDESFCSLSLYVISVYAGRALLFFLLTIGSLQKHEMIFPRRPRVFLVPPSPFLFLIAGPFSLLGKFLKAID